MYLVVGDDEYCARKARHDLAFFRPRAYECGYVDSKVVSVAILEATAERGREAMRWSFTGSTAIYTTIGDVQPLLDRIPVYPEGNRLRNMRDFYSQFAIDAGYLAQQALERGDNPFVPSHSLALAAFYAGRMMLAYNRLLYPCRKRLLAAVASCPDLPEAFVERTEALLREPTIPTLQSYIELVTNFTDWGTADYVELVTRYWELEEWSWLEGEPTVAQC